jgi:hypothetical protein
MKTQVISAATFATVLGVVGSGAHILLANPAESVERTTTRHQLCAEDPTVTEIDTATEVMPDGLMIPPGFKGQIEFVKSTAHGKPSRIDREMGAKPVRTRPAIAPGGLVNDAELPYRIRYSLATKARRIVWDCRWVDIMDPLPASMAPKPKLEMIE